MSADIAFRERRIDDGEGAGMLRVVWSLRGQSAGAEPEPIVSDGCAELVFNFGDPFEQRTASGSFIRQPSAMVVGPTAAPTFVRPTGAVDIVGVRLHPWAISSFLGVD